VGEEWANLVTLFVPNDNNCTRQHSTTLASGKQCDQIGLNFCPLGEIFWRWAHFFRKIPPKYNSGEFFFEKSSKMQLN
jgi:hypothetical protein